jgi:hypothetical protein
MHAKDGRCLRVERAERSAIWDTGVLRASLYGIATIGALSCGDHVVVCLADPESGAIPEGCREELADIGDAISGAPVELGEAHDTDLGIGSSGDDVRALHQYLQSYGYFPNDDLRGRYSWWRPIIASGPADPRVYDERTEEAVTALQVNSGLEPTGYVDAATRAVLTMPRCGVPDGPRAFAADGKIEKFAHAPAAWARGVPVTWKVVTSTSSSNPTLSPALGTGETINSVLQAAAAAAFATWENEMGLDLNLKTTAGNADIHIRWHEFGASPPLADGETPDYSGVKDIRVSTDGWTWSTDGSVGSGQYDLQSLLLHEIGHSLGLAHSSIGTGGTNNPTIDSIMNSGLSSAQSATRALNVDDRVAISVLYDDWEWLQGQTARDIGVGMNGDAWITGGSSGSGGYLIYKRNGSSWSLESSGGRALRIAVGPTGVPWVVASDNAVYRRTSSSHTSGTWQWIQGACATDIAVGGDNSVWIIGCVSGSGGYEIKELVSESGGVGTWQLSNGRAVRIAVDQVGVPWVVASDNAVYRRTSATAASGSWNWLPGTGQDFRATDIAAGPVGVDDSGVKVSYVFALGATPVAGGYNVFAWNEQSVGDGNPVAPVRSHWVQTNGAAMNISMGPDAQPWVVASDLAAYRRLR